ncbi:hypothetical protein [Frankia tisae]|uniref:hypothetical protein n=1 Tax=Frankia tisae TaxID=2950104 RepID=UPI0021C0A9BF|nr:hypothetical protein [Frankia tisae]
MTELGGGGYEKRAGSGAPRRDRPDRPARPEAPTGSAGSPSDPTGDGGIAPAGAADLPDPTSAGGQDLRGRYVSYDGWTPPSDDPLFGGPRTYAFSFDHVAASRADPGPDPGAAWSTSAASTPEPTPPGPTTPEPTTPAQSSPSSEQQIVSPTPSPAPTGFPPQPETTHGPSGPATGWSIRGWSGAPDQLTGITPLSDPNPSTEPHPLPRMAPPAGTGERRDSAARARDSRRLLAIVAGAVLVLIAAVAIVALRGGDDDKGGGAPAASGTLPPVPANFLSTAAVDADPITPDEFFPEQSVAVDTHGYQRLARKLDTGCPNLTGDLIAQLKAAHCRQVVRSLFLSRPQQGERQVLAGATVFSLDTSATATQAAQVLNQGRGGIAPLPIPAGSIQNAQITGPGGNNSWRGAISRGHYLIYTQVAYVDGTLGAATDQPLRNAQTDLATLATEPIGDRAVLGHGPRR